MTARQYHGFWFEKKAIQKYGLTSCSGYTCKYDAFYSAAKIPVQIKYVKRGCSVELGGYLRNKQKKEDFILIVGIWENKKDNIIDEIILYIEHENFTKQLAFDFDAEMFEEMKLISNLRLDDFKWSSFCKKYKQVWCKENLLDIRFKRDHKKQKRIQCSISWKKFNKDFLSLFKRYDLKINLQ